MSSKEFDSATQRVQEIIDAINIPDEASSAVKDLLGVTRTVYIRDTGNDNTADGSLSKPYRTIQKALDAVLPRYFTNGEFIFDVDSSTGEWDEYEVYFPRTKCIDQLLIAENVYGSYIEKAPIIIRGSLRTVYNIPSSAFIDRYGGFPLAGGNMKYQLQNLQPDGITFIQHELIGCFWSESIHPVPGGVTTPIYDNETDRFTLNWGPYISGVGTIVTPNITTWTYFIMNGVESPVVFENLLFDQFAGVEATRSTELGFLGCAFVGAWDPYFIKVDKISIVCCSFSFTTRIRLESVKELLCSNSCSDDDLIEVRDNNCDTFTFRAVASWSFPYTNGADYICKSLSLYYYSLIERYWGEQDFVGGLIYMENVEVAANSIMLFEKARLTLKGFITSEFDSVYYPGDGVIAATSDCIIETMYDIPSQMIMDDAVDQSIRLARSASFDISIGVNEFAWEDLETLDIQGGAIRLYHLAVNQANYERGGSINLWKRLLPPI